MSQDQIKIYFVFPNKPKSHLNKSDFVNLLLNKMEIDRNINYVGYSDNKIFREDLDINIGNGSISNYEPISIKKMNDLKRQIMKTIEKCNELLPHPDLPIFVFLYPWFPNKEDSIAFQGTTAFSSYYSMHVFIDLEKYSDESLSHTIAHEWNHLVFYRYHLEKEYSLKTFIIMEGMAEVFREEVVGGDPAPWSIKLSKNEIDDLLVKIKDRLEITGIDLYRSIFFGDREYKRWSGYSIGYLFVKKYRAQHPDIQWLDIIKTSSSDILVSDKKEA